MFLKTCGMAERRALSLPHRALPPGGESEVQARDYGGRLIGRLIKNQFHLEPASDKRVPLAAGRSKAPANGSGLRRNCAA